MLEAWERSIYLWRVKSHVSTKAYARRQDDERRKKEAKLKEDQKAFERRCAEREAELARRTRDVWNREQAVTRSEAHTDAKLNEAKKILNEAKAALKTAQNASEGALDVTMESWMRTHYATNPANGRKESHYDIIFKAAHADRNKALSKGWTAVDELQSKADYMKQRDAQQSDDQQYT